MGFFDAPQLVNKNHSSTFHSMMFLFHTKIYTVKYKANDCENTLFVQRETRTTVLHSVNLSIYEIKTLLYSDVCFMQLCVNSQVD